MPGMRPGLRLLLLSFLLFFPGLPARAGSPPATAASEGAGFIGHYKCTFTQGEYSYPPFRCSISRRGAVLWLEKQTGSQRIRGEVTPIADGFRFSGTFFCPYGDCTRPVSGDFHCSSPRECNGTLDDGPPPTMVRLTRTR
jgi:hypothetical protein